MEDRNANIEQCLDALTIDKIALKARNEKLEAVAEAARHMWQETDPQGLGRLGSELKEANETAIAIALFALDKKDQQK